METLLFDVSVLERFVNERIVITTRIYPDSGECYGLQPFIKHRQGLTGGGEAIVSRCVGWELKSSIFHDTQKQAVYFGDQHDTTNMLLAVHVCHQSF